MDILELRVALNVSEDDDQFDPTIEALYALSKKIFTQYTRVGLTESVVTQSLVGFEGSVIYLDCAPYVSMTSVNSFSTFNGDATSITDYQVINNIVYLNSSITTAYTELVYTAGYATIPTEIDRILVQITSFLWTFSDRKVMLSSSGEAILEPDQVKLPKVVRDNIAIYRIGI